MDFGKFTYEKTRKEREARKNQKQIEIKTIKLSPKIAKFHRDLNVRKAKLWLGQGKKVKVVVRFRGREITYPELGQQMMEGIATELEGYVHHRTKTQFRRVDHGDAAGSAGINPRRRLDSTTEEIS